MSKKPSSDTPLVWSSEVGRICPGCGKGTAHCTCRRGAISPAGDGVIRVRRESKGRGGKTVTVITGIPGGDEAVRGIARELKRRCGSGGTVKDGTIEIQGDHRHVIVADLEKQGMRVKLAGG
jgi:translation initiation factor 1